MITWIARVPLYTTLDYIKRLILKTSKTQRLNQRTHTLCEKLLRIVCLRVLQPSASKSSTCFEVKNFATNNNFLVAQSQSYSRICACKEVFNKNNSNWGLVERFNCKLVFWDSTWSGDLKFTRWGFCLTIGFPHLSTNHRVYLISAALNLFGDLLVPPQFACNLIELINLRN